jgi:hypothetical protein
MTRRRVTVGLAASEFERVQAYIAKREASPLANLWRRPKMRLSDAVRELVQEGPMNAEGRR